MARALLVVLALSAPLAAMAADDLRVMQLEQDVRALRRDVQQLRQQLSSLQLATPAPGQRPAVPPAAGSPGATPAPGAVPPWVDASKWEQLRPGMAELDVIGTLGPPTSMRTQGADRVLLYAMEIGTSGFLGGSVTLRDRAVVEVQKPVLR